MIVMPGFHRAITQHSRTNGINGTNERLGLLDSIILEVVVRDHLQRMQLSHRSMIFLLFKIFALSEPL